MISHDMKYQNLKSAMTEFDDTDSKARHIVGYDGEKLMLKKICTPEFNDLLNEAM